MLGYTNDRKRLPVLQLGASRPLRYSLTMRDGLIVPRWGAGERFQKNQKTRGHHIEKFKG